jgi:dihydroorotase
MKDIFIKDATIFDPGNPGHNLKSHLLIRNGLIEDIGEEIMPQGTTEVFDAGNMFLSAGWMDLRVDYCDPGHEHREDLVSGSNASAYGGFTSVGLMPDTDPPLYNKGQIEYILSNTRLNPVKIYPLGSLSVKNGSRELTEMYDLAYAGVSAFSSGRQAISDHGFLLRALDYASGVGKPVFLFPENSAVAGHGQINEGLINIQLGIKGSPIVAEEIEISNIIRLAEYSGTPVHISNITSARSVELISRAHESGLQITADVSIHHLQFTDGDLLNFNTNLKLRPPLRTIEDCEALQQAVLSMDYICITSSHTPLEEDKKKCEFEIAYYGAIGTQTLFSQLVSIFGDNWMKAMPAIISRPRQILNLETPSLLKGSRAELTIFDPAETWTFNDSTNKSKSRNSPVWHRLLKGKAKAIFNNNTLKILN